MNERRLSRCRADWRWHYVRVFGPGRCFPWRHRVDVPVGLERNVK